MRIRAERGKPPVDARVGLRREGDHRVRDNGPGIPAEVLDHIFDADWSTKPRTESRERRGAGARPTVSHLTL